MRRSWSVAVVIVLARGSSGCAEPEEPGEDLPEPEPEPARILVEPAPGARICAGTERWLDQELARVQAMTGLEPRFDLPVTLGEGPVQERCIDDADTQTVLGCSVGTGATTAVITGPSVLAHELVHGLRRQYDLRTQAMFEEGFAELLDGSDAYPRTIALEPATLDDSLQPEAMVQLQPEAFRDPKHYRSATHFLDFVATEHGLDALAAFMRGGIDDSADAAVMRFATDFGRSLTEQAQAWRDEATEDSRRGELCADAITALPPGEKNLLALVDCDAGTTMGLAGAGEEAWVRLCVRMPEIRYAMTLDAESGVVQWDVVPGTCANGVSPSATSQIIEAGESSSIHLGTCAWALTFRSTAEAPESFTLALRPE